MATGLPAAAAAAAAVLPPQHPPLPSARSNARWSIHPPLTVPLPLTHTPPCSVPTAAAPDRTHYSQSPPRTHTRAPLVVPLVVPQADADVLQERQKYMDEWAAYVERRRCYAQLLADFKRELVGPARYAERESTIQKVLVEQVIEVKEEPYATAAAKQ